MSVSTDDVLTEVQDAIGRIDQIDVRLRRIERQLRDIADTVERIKRNTR